MAKRFRKKFVEIFIKTHIRNAELRIEKVTSSKMVDCRLIPTVDFSAPEDFQIILYINRYSVFSLIFKEAGRLYFQHLQTVLLKAVCTVAPSRATLLSLVFKHRAKLHVHTHTHDSTQNINRRDSPILLVPRCINTRFWWLSNSLYGINLAHSRQE